MQNSEQKVQPENSSGALAVLGFVAVMQSDEMWVLQMKEKKAQECPSMTAEELHDYMMDIYAERKQDRHYDRDHYNY